MLCISRLHFKDQFFQQWRLNSFLLTPHALSSTAWHIHGKDWQLWQVVAAIAHSLQTYKGLVFMDHEMGKRGKSHGPRHPIGEEPCFPFLVRRDNFRIQEINAVVD